MDSFENEVQKFRFHPGCSGNPLSGGQKMPEEDDKKKTEGRALLQTNNLTSSCNSHPE